MRKVILLCVGICFSMSSYALADELSDLRKEVEKLGKKVDALESHKANGQEFLTKKGARFQLGGKVEIEYIDTEWEKLTGEQTREPNPHFGVELRLIPKFIISENISIEAQYDIQQDKGELNEAYVTFSGLPLHSELKIGLDDRFMKSKRKTESYSLSATAFSRDEESGVFLTSRPKPFYVHFSVTQGNEISTKGVGKDKSFKMLHDNDREDTFHQISYFGAGLGFQRDWATKKGIDILTFAYRGDLSDTDMETLKNKLQNYSSMESKKYKFGVKAELKLGPFGLLGDYVRAKDGNLKRNAWYVTPRYKFSSPVSWKYFKKHDLRVRYGEYNIDTELNLDKPASWDRSELSFLWVITIYKSTTLTTEYRVNEEETGGGSIANNEVIMSLKVKI